MIYRRMLIPIIIAVTLAQFKHCSARERSTSPNALANNQQLTRSNSLPKNRVQLPNDPDQKKEVASATPRPRRTRPLPRSPSTARSLDDKNKSTRPSQGLVRSRSLQQPPEEKTNPNESNDTAGKETGNNQSKILMPFRAVKQTGNYILRSAINVISAPLSGQNKN